MNSLVNSVEQRSTKQNEHSELAITVLQGTFTAEDSSHAVLSLVNEARHYHTVRNQNHQERFGCSDPSAEKVLTNISKSYKKTLELIHQAQTNDIPLQVETTIKVTLAKN